MGKRGGFKRKYTDVRGKFGRRSAEIVAGLIADFGGKENLTAAQRVILTELPRKLGILASLGEDIDRGGVLQDIRHVHLRYSNSVTRDMALLYGLRDRKPAKKEPTLAEFLKSQGAAP